VLWPKCEEHTLKASKLFVRVNNQFSKLVKELKFAHLVDATNVFITMQEGLKEGFGLFSVYLQYV